MPQRKRERSGESGEQRQERIQQEQHRPEQNEGYDEAAHAGREVANDEQLEDLVAPLSTDEPSERAARIDDRETKAAIEDVRRHEHSADRGRGGL